ncbi:MAG TPA: hypothetical protein VEA38_04505 [Terriglobales bacterium]|nr:hypothetical protein [Terriglobales bacterium]
MKRILLAATLLAATGAAHAAGVGIRAGTLGLGADVAWSVAPTLSARLGYSRLDWNRDYSTGSVRYDGDIKLSNFNALLDFSPLGPFRLTGGVILNNNRYEANGVAAAGTVSGEVKASRRVAPYLGVGYGNVSGAGINFYADLGVMFMGSPRASLSATCAAGIGAGACAAFQGEVAEEQRRLEDRLKSFKYYPVLNVGLTIGF